MNEFKLYGKVLETPVLIEDIDGDKSCSILLEVNRGNNIVSNFKIYCYKMIAEDVCNNLKKGNKCVIKGHLNGYVKEYDEVDMATLIAERVEYI